MWPLSSQALLRKQTVKVAQRQMSTVMSFGSGWYGPFGLPKEEQAKAYAPAPIPSLPSDIVSVHAGYSHSFALTSQGHLWARGWNRHCELGRSGFDMLLGLIDGSDGENPISVSVGLAHSLALTSKEKLWVWSSSTDGTLGFASPAKQLVPYHLDSLEGFKILQAVAGFEHTLVLVANRFSCFNNKLRSISTTNN